ncbi:MAG: hypothetical protein KJZ80_03555 [Hyphomicrobiaceae bacterium]|nr:hypothetical protein [Hyphomicrobiaceae bacterium]
MTCAASLARLWLVDVVRAGPALAALEAATPRLSEDERARAAALARHGEDWRLLRIALRVLLEGAVGPKLRLVPFRTSRRGKPALPWRAGVEFSLSHSGRLGLVAIAAGPVGVDLEHEREVRFPADRQQAMLAAARALAPTAGRAGDRAPDAPGILQAWVRLEAWGKARGSGVGALLHDLGIRGRRWTAGGGAADDGELAAALLRQEALDLHDLDLPPGLFGAVAGHDLAAPPPVRDFPADFAAMATLASAA